ncbi:MAG: hypothetical protein JWP87_4543 [Labilithrix sp.]|nr:hypothetical protein [Labilithrix sp.]
MPAVKRSPSLFAAVVAIALVPSCSSPSSTPAEPGTFTTIYPLLFPVSTNARCNFCHGLPANETSNGKLFMGTDKATAYAALIGKLSTGNKCPNETLVVPNDPEGSLFYQKLTASPPCGSRMPLGGTPLSGEQLEMVRSWIAAGAKDD